MLISLFLVRVPYWSSLFTVSGMTGIHRIHKILVMVLLHWYSGNVSFLYRKYGVAHCCEFTALHISSLTGSWGRECPWVYFVNPAEQTKLTFFWVPIWTYLVYHHVTLDLYPINFIQPAHLSYRGNPCVAGAGGLVAMTDPVTPSLDASGKTSFRFRVEAVLQTCDMWRGHPSHERW